MKRLLFLLLPLLFSAQCIVQKENINETKTTIFGDQKLKDIHNDFISDLIEHKMFTLTKKHLRVFDYQPLGYGYWGLTFPEAAVIVIDTTFMEGSEELLYVVSYHELAHFYLKAKHDEYCGLCIMQPRISVEDAKKMYENFEFQKQWLFRSNYSIPYFLEFLFFE